MADPDQPTNPEQPLEEEAHPAPRPSIEHERAKAFALEAARTMRDDKCEDVVVLDLRGRSQVTDFFVIGSGTSDVQMRTVARDLEKLGKDSGFRVFRASEAGAGSTWIALDFVSVVAHVFAPQTRVLYDLELLWGDAPRLRVASGEPRPRTIDGNGQDA